MDDAEVRARVEIGDLVARYNANGDSGRFDQVLELFTDDAALVIDGVEHRGHEAIHDVFTGAVRRSGDTEPTPIRHFTATHQVDLVDAQRATGRCYFEVLTDIGLDHWGRYVDDYVVVDRRWRFAARRVSVDGYAKRSRFRS